MGTARERLVGQLVRGCENGDALWRWVEVFGGVRVPRRGVCEGHVGPFEYLRSAYFEPGRDLVVWAPRGGGKTKLGAVATMLDLLHKGEVQVRILGGSLEQSSRMWEHLLAGMEPYLDWVGGEVRGRGIRLANGAGCGILTQSQRSVRGVRVQKLRCDEVEVFDREVWEAAQLVTKSKELPVASCQLPVEEGGKNEIRGAVEALSTLHEPFGLMGKVVEEAERRGTRVLKWCLMEVLERCPAERQCEGCELWGECGGRAKEKEAGFVSIEDAIRMKRRVSLETWEAEMLCKRPSVRRCVFPTFDPSVHVREDPGIAIRGLSGGGGRVTLAVDFGFAAPLVCLWVRTDGEGNTYVVDEYVQPGRTIGEHVDFIESKGWGAERWVACDPAGSGVSDQTAVSNVGYLRSRGYVVKCRKSLIVEGLEMVRAALRPAAGEVRLHVHPRCERLIRALRGYRYAEGGSELPVKDGEHDHLIDALRYHFVNASSLSEGKRWRQY